ncbi:MAG: hypothetical protein HC828_06775 [Blastochloris sp.]|nr:hypothetical protein [Blastochloris sp.]
MMTIIIAGFLLMGSGIVGYVIWQRQRHQTPVGAPPWGAAPRWRPPWVTGAPAPARRPSPQVPWFLALGAWWQRLDWSSYVQEVTTPTTPLVGAPSARWRSGGATLPQDLARLTASLTAAALPPVQTLTVQRRGVQVTLTQGVPPHARRPVVQHLAAQGLHAAWHGSQLQVRGPLVALPPGAVPVVPLWRQRTGVVWWSLGASPVLLLAGAAHATLALQLAALQTDADRVIWVHDPQHRLARTPFAIPPATPDALFQALQHIRQQQFQPPCNPQTATHVLAVVEPDAATWVRVYPFLRDPPPGVALLVLVGPRSDPALLREVCHRVPVLDVGSRTGSTLPDACRLPGVPPPRPGQALVWWGRQHLGQGRPITSPEGPR